jgi:hypothetical protein
VTGRTITNVAVAFLFLSLLAIGWYTLGQVVGLREDIHAVPAAAVEVAIVSVTYTDTNGDPQRVEVRGPADDPAGLTRKLREQVRAHEKEFPRER